jgi:hypothetical protein
VTLHFAAAGIKSARARLIIASRKHRKLVLPFLRWSDWIGAYRATAEFFDRRLPASGERQRPAPLETACTHGVESTNEMKNGLGRPSPEFRCAMSSTIPA